MTKRELLALEFNLSKIDLVGSKFAYAIAKNLNIIKPETDALRTAKDKIVMKCVKLGENGKPEIKIIDPETGRGEYIIEKQDEWDKGTKDYDKLLDEESKVKLYKIKISDVPEQITTQQMTAIFELIEEDKKK
jgi:hypothetical protein